MLNDMTTIRFIGWKDGVRKIKFITLLHEEGGLNLKKAKEIKDKVISIPSEAVEVKFKNDLIAKLIYEKALSLGVLCEIVGNE